MMILKIDYVMVSRSLFEADFSLDWWLIGLCDIFNDLRDCQYKYVTNRYIIVFYYAIKYVAGHKY